MANEVMVRAQQPLAPVKYELGYSDLERWAVQAEESKLWSVKKKAEAMMVMWVAQSQGRHPVTGLMDYNVIDGKPAMKGDTMLSRYQEAGGRVDWLVMTDAKVEAKFSPPAHVGSPLTIAWTVEMAAVAGLAEKQNWRKYGRAMLRNRVISEGVRATLPGCIGSGIYIPEELSEGDLELREMLTVNDAKRETAESVRKEEPPIDVDTETGEIRTEQPPVEDPGMTEGEVADHLAAIDSAATIMDLKKAHSVAYTAAHAMHDKDALLKFEVAKNKRKYELTKAGAAA